MNQTFKISPRILAHLGEDLISNESIALLELVKNSYDAGASYCCVSFHRGLDTSIDSITISDDGQGMSRETVENVWLVIGTDNKKGSPQVNGRWPLGEKGIGRLGVHKLGRKIQMFTKTVLTDEVEVNIDWNGLKTATRIEDFFIDVEENKTAKVFSNNTIGTKIVIEDLKSSWNNRQLRSIYRDLNSLNSPFLGNSDSFTVKIESNDNIFGNLPDIEEILKCGMYKAHCRLEGSCITDFKYEFKPWTSLNKITGGREVYLNDLSSNDIEIKGIEEKITKNRADFFTIDLDANKIGPIEFDIVIFEKDRAVWNYLPIEKTSVDDYLRENGGIRVYRDNIRVYNYGERDNDWLGIDIQRIRRMGSHISNNIVVGSVQLQRNLSTGLREKTNREGFIEDEVYRNFSNAINYVLSLVVRLRIEDKQRLLSLYKNKATEEPVLESLNSVIDIIESSSLEPLKKQEVINYINRANKEYIEVRDVLLKSANAGLNLSMVIHELEKQIAALKGCATRGETENIISISKRLEDLVRRHTIILRRNEVKRIQLSKIIEEALENYRYRFLDHNIEIFKEIDNTLYVTASEAESIGALINLLDNSIYWVSTARTEERKIAIATTSEFDGYNTIVIADNGPGFNIGTDVAVKPFITGKPHNYGMGLGLHVVNEIMNAVNGKLIFLEKNDIQLSSVFSKNQIESAIIALCFKKG